MNKIWNKVKKQSIINLSSEFKAEFICKFDNKIPQEMKDKLLSFVAWVEENYGIQTPVYVNFEYKNYVLTEERERVGYLFYWSDFSNYPNFTEEDDTPIIILPVKDEQWTYEEIIGSFVEALTDYYAWVLNTIEEYEIDDVECETIVNDYLMTL